MIADPAECRFTCMIPRGVALELGPIVSVLVMTLGERILCSAL